MDFEHAISISVSPVCMLPLRYCVDVCSCRNDGFSFPPPLPDAANAPLPNAANAPLAPDAANAPLAPDAANAPLPNAANAPLPNAANASPAISEDLGSQDSDTDSHDSVCHECGNNQIDEYDDPEETNCLMCDFPGCRNIAHATCAGYPDISDANMIWFCRLCRSRQARIARQARLTANPPLQPDTPDPTLNAQQPGSHGPLAAIATAIAAAFAMLDDDDDYMDR